MILANGSSKPCGPSWGWHSRFVMTIFGLFLANHVPSAPAPAREVQQPQTSLSLVCAACQALSATVLDELKRADPPKVDALGAAVAQRLSKTTGNEQIQIASVAAAMPKDRIASRCAQLLRADRPVLRRLVQEHAVDGTWEGIARSLCFDRLRCRPDEPLLPQISIHATVPVQQAAHDAITKPATDVLGDSIGDGSTCSNPECRGSYGPPAGERGEERKNSKTGNLGLTTYERMLADYSMAADHWPPSPHLAQQPEAKPRQQQPQPEQQFRYDAERELQRELESNAEDSTSATILTSKGVANKLTVRTDEQRPPEERQALQLQSKRVGRRGMTQNTSAYADITIEDRLPFDPLNPPCPERKDRYRDLVDVRIVAVIFCGRRDRLRILLRYLEKSLRKNGGVVDQVIFALWQVTERDLVFVEKLARESGNKSDRGRPLYEIRDYTEQSWGPAIEGAEPSTNRMVRLYQGLDEPGTVYVKIDDDVVYFAPHSIADLVREYRRGRCLFVSANVVNHAIMSSLHQDRGAHRGFWPPSEQRKQPSLRLPWEKVSEINTSPQFQFDRFPASKCVVERWDCAALVHESFLDRANEKTICAFDFGWHDFNRAGYREHRYIHRSPSINKEYWSEGARWSTNMFAFTKDDLEDVNWQAVYGKGDDEEEFTGPHAERRDKHSCAVGSAIAVHFSYGSQEDGLMAYTDLLRRYEKLSRRLAAPTSRARPQPGTS